MNEQLIDVEELARLTGCSVQTLNIYYRFKKNSPDDEYAQMLPNYIQEGKRQKRYWKREDANAIIEFREMIPQGRSGVLGYITQRHYKNDRPDKEYNPLKEGNGKYIDLVASILNRNSVDPSTIRIIQVILKNEYDQRSDSDSLRKEKDSFVDVSHEILSVHKESRFGDIEKRRPVQSSGWTKRNRRAFMIALFGKDMPIPDNFDEVFDSQVESIAYEKVRTVIVKHWKEGEPVRQIAEELGVSRQQVYNLKNKGLRMLRHPSRSRYFKVGLHN